MHPAQVQILDRAHAEMVMAAHAQRTLRDASDRASGGSELSRGQGYGAPVAGRRGPIVMRGVRSADHDLASRNGLAAHVHRRLARSSKKIEQSVLDRHMNTRDTG